MNVQLHDFAKELSEEGYKKMSIYLDEVRRVQQKEGYNKALDDVEKCMDFFEDKIQENKFSEGHLYKNFVEIGEITLNKLRRMFKKLKKKGEGK